MEGVPAWSGPLESSFAWCVVAEAVDEGVPDGAVALDEEGFAEWNPDVIDDEIAAGEVFEVKV